MCGTSSSVKALTQECCFGHESVAAGLEVALFFDDSNVCSVFSRDCCHEDLFEFFDAADCF